VSGIVAGLTAGGWSLLVGWMFPTAISMGLFVTLLAPQTHLQIAGGWSADQRTLALTAATLGLALMLNAAQVLLYRALEGYLWPAPLRRRGAARQRARRDRLRQAAQTASGLERALLNEKAARYPIDDRQIAPTRLGNAIRAFETYSFDRFRLDSQLLWSELEACAPPQLRKSLERAQAGVDFFVCLLFTQVLLALAGITVLVTDNGSNLTAALTAATAFALLPLWYTLAVITTDPWHAGVQALTNLGRKPLADALGFDLPRDFAEEREFWRRVNWLVRRDYDDRLAPQLTRLGHTRPPTESTPGTSSQPPPDDPDAT
jgi:hypothetical protein